MSSELLATYSGLGIHDGEDYCKGDECLACVKDLIRSLRTDDSSCEIRRQLGQAGILQKDLLPILVSSGDDPVLRNDVIRLLVNLTQPAYLCFGSEYPKKKEMETMKCFMEVNHYLRQYKEAFTTENVMNVLGSVLADLCQKDWDDRDDDDIIVIERILLLVRNILHITPDPQEEKRTEDDVSIHDQVIWNLHVNGIDELLLFLGSNPDESQWCMHVLEIVFLMMREQSASALARTGKGRSTEEKKKDEDIVDELLAREKSRKLKAQHIRGTRHSRFGGTFVVTNQKSIVGTERVYHRPVAGLQEYSYDVEKRPRRTPKPKRAAKDVPSNRLSTYSIRVVLKDVCVQFLECCFNPLMRVVRDNIMHQRAMDNDETYYLWAIRFFMDFSRMHDFRVDIVGEALQLSTLHYIIQLMATYYDTMVMEKKRPQDAQQWGQRLHYALQAYKELLLYIQEMTTSKDKVFQENAKVMQSNVFYHPEYRDIFVTLFRNFREVFLTKSYLRDLVETTHIFVRMMERFCHDNKHMVVQGRRKKSKKKKRSTKGPKHPGGVLMEHQLIDLWEKMDARVEELLEGWERLPDTSVPFDATSDTPMEEQKIVAMGRIRLKLIEACHDEAVSLLRAAREVWPDDAFGHSGMSADEEVDTIKSILFNPAAALPAARLLEDADEDQDDEEDDEEGGGREVVTYELEFDLKKYLQRFINNKIVRACCIILADYRTNSDAINHAVVKMLHRISVDFKMAPLLYQLSVFRTLQAILHEPTSARYKELQKFARYIVAGFFHMASKNSLMFAELLFWKTSGDCYELTEGYGTLEREKELRKLSSVWTHEQDEELRELFARFKGENDILTCIEDAISKDIPRSRRQISKQLVALGLAGSTKEFKKKNPLQKKGAWSEEEVCRLREVFQLQPGEDYKMAVLEIADYFPERLVRDIMQQLRTLGLLPDPAKKKRRRSEEDNSDSREDEGQSSTAPPLKRGRKEAGYGGMNGDGRGRREEKEGRKEGRGEGKRKEGVKGLVSCLHDGGYSHQLAWLEAYLNDEARDRRLDDEWEEMCIVPVSDTVSRALEVDGFKELLASLRLQPPTQQEIYWRIPPTMTPLQLSSAANSLRAAVDGEEEDDVASEGGSEMGEEDGDGERMSPELDSDDSSEEEEMTISDALATLRSTRKKKEISEVDQKTPRSAAKERESRMSKKPQLATHSSFLESESEEAPVRDEVEVVNPSGAVPMGSLDLPSALGRKRIRRLMDSDSEDEEGGNPPSDEGGERSDTALSSPEDETNDLLLTEHDQIYHHVKGVEPVESPPTSTQNANAIIPEVRQLDSVSDVGREQQFTSHTNDGSMPELALSQTVSSEMQPVSLGMEQQNTVLSPSEELSTSQPQTYTDTNILPECSGSNTDIDAGDGAEPTQNSISNLEHRHRSKRRCMLLDLESSDEEL